MLSYRARRILFALISEYISTGEAVSSGTLARAHGIDLSSASVRAVFAELENLGYLLKPHTSAGRIPTEKGFRAFVDALVASSELPDETLVDLENRFAATEPGLDAAVRMAGRILADVTGSASVVVTAPRLSLVLRDVRFIALRQGEALAVIVGSNGAVQNRVLRIEEGVTPADLERANNMLKPWIEGRTLTEVRQLLADELATESARCDQQARLAITLGERALAQVEHDADVVVEGHAQLIERPEFADIERARQAMRTLGDRERLVRLLDRTLAAPGIQVLIGSEDEATGAGDLSVVAAQFGSGSLGVIGSTRMDYPSVVPVVRHTARMLARLLHERRGGDPGDDS